MSGRRQQDVAALEQLTEALSRMLDMTSLTELPALEIVPGYEGFAAIHPHGGAIGLLILSEMFGVTPAMRDAARDFARV